MMKTAKNTAVNDLPEVKGAFVGNTLRPFTADEFRKVEMILASKKTRERDLRITNRELRGAGLEHLAMESANEII